MNFATPRQRMRLIAALATLHVVIIAASNYLVQIPFTVAGINGTWGIFSYPFVFLATDLTVRFFGAAPARRIVFRAMFPALVASYLFSVLFERGAFAGWQALLVADVLVLRIVLASFLAYLFGQLLDIFVFKRLLRQLRWWIAPTVSMTLGNLLDTLVFYAIAFAGGSDAFMAAHWPAIAAADYSFKLIVCISFFVPLYGVFLNWLQRHLLLLTDSEQESLATAPR